MGIHSSGFKDFLLKPELLRAIQDCGFEHPSEGEPTGPGERPLRVAASGSGRDGWRERAPALGQGCRLLWGAASLPLE